LSEEQRTKVVELQDELRRTGADVKYVEPQNLHITLNFFGDVTDVEELKKKFSEAVEGKESFEVSLKGTGAFPSLHHLKVVWVGVKKGKETVAELSTTIGEKVGLGLDAKKGFRAHVTLGRVRSERNNVKLAAKLKVYEKDKFGAGTVEEVVLKKSELTPKGPVYTTICSIKLNK